MQGRTTRARDQGGQSPEQNSGLWDGRGLPNIVEHPWKSEQSGDQRKRFRINTDVEAGNTNLGTWMLSTTGKGFEQTRRLRLGVRKEEDQV